MRVVAPEPAVAVRRERDSRPANIEMLGLLAATVVVLFGVALAGWTKTERLADVAPLNGVIPLYALSAPADLEPALTMFDSPRERQRVARAVYERAKAADPIDHVGALAGVGSLSRANLQALKPRLAVRSVEQYRRGLAGSVALFVGAFWIVHLFRRWRGRDDDALLLPALMLLCGIGLMTMCALRDPIRDTMTVSVFAGGVALGLVLLAAASEIDFESSPLRRAVVLPLGLACLLATLLLVLGSGPGSSGVKVNLFGVQPVEAVRLLVVFALAAYFGRRVELLRELSEPPAPSRPWLRFVSLPRWRDVRPVLAAMALVLTFFFLQKDFGPALVLSCVFLGLFGIARGRPWLVVAGFAILLAGFTAAYWTGFPGTVRNRVMIWANPWNNGVPGGNHVTQGLWALSTGGLWGSGPGLGSPGSVPEAHTDFVLAAIGEELGWIGLAALVAAVRVPVLAVPSHQCEGPGRLHHVSRRRRRAGVERAGARDRGRAARADPALGSRHAVSELRPLVDARQLCGDRDRDVGCAPADARARAHAAAAARRRRGARPCRARHRVARHVGAGAARRRHRRRAESRRTG